MEMKLMKKLMSKPVFATAVLDRSSSNVVTRSDLNFLEGLIFREQHLKENIRELEYGQHFSQEFGRNDFKHTIELRIVIKTEKLWESPRSYLWKFLGQYEWTKGDGTKVLMNKIDVSTWVFFPHNNTVFFFFQK